MSFFGRESFIIFSGQFKIKQQTYQLLWKIGNIFLFHKIFTTGRYKLSEEAAKNTVALLNLAENN